ncbi:hypothetical protein [Pseudooceanicola sp.]|uniref:hypothetical protein n=1 Tax=Pseudooceanicola sp. TaxID=1914328 RepID=UPI003511EFEE
MTPKRKRALEWCRDDGNHLDIPEADEPSKAMLLRLEREGLVQISVGRFEPLRWKLTQDGEDALSS